MSQLGTLSPHPSPVQYPAQIYKRHILDLSNGIMFYLMTSYFRQIEFHISGMPLGGPIGYRQRAFMVGGINEKLHYKYAQEKIKLVH